MPVFILLKIIFIILITIILIAKPDIRQAKHFLHQIWTTSEVLPYYWTFVVLSLLSLILFKTISSHQLLYQFISYFISLFAGLILYWAVRNIIIKKGLPISAIGLQSLDIFWFTIIIIVQYILLIVLLPEKDINSYRLIIWSFIYYSAPIIIWPIIEEVFYLGLFYIPITRKFGLINGALLVSAIRSLSHIDYNIHESIMNLIIFGIVGCFLYIKTKRILPPLLVHSSFNFLILIRELWLI